MAVVASYDPGHDHEPGGVLDCDSPSGPGGPEVDEKDAEKTLEAATPLGLLLVELPAKNGRWNAVVGRWLTSWKLAGCRRQNPTQTALARHNLTVRFSFGCSHFYEVRWSILGATSGGSRGPNPLPSTI